MMVAVLFQLLAAKLQQGRVQWLSDMHIFQSTGYEKAIGATWAPYENKIRIESPREGRPSL